MTGLRRGPLALVLGVVFAVLGALAPAGAAEAAVEALPPEVAFESAALVPEGPLVPPVVSALGPADHPRIDKALTYYLGPGRAWVAKALERVQPYRDFIRGELSRRGMPDDLFWLACVESGFNPGATSRVGAAGLWQFMRNSVAGYDMHINSFVDERRDWWKSTLGALDKLQDNYDRLGDWYLALAAYNAGLGRIQGIVKRNGGEKDYWKLLDKGVLPRETSGYVPQIVALSRAAAQWDTSGFPVDWDPSPEWTRIQVNKMVDLRLLAQAAGVPYEDLKAANKELAFHLTPSLPGGYHLKVRPEWEGPLARALADPDLKLIQYYLYTVKKGDTLSEIAQWYGVSTDMLQRDNPGLVPSRLKIGQNLVIAAIKDVGPFQKGARRG